LAPLALLLLVAPEARSASHSSAARTLILYSVADVKQFVNNADDRSRGKGANPFGNYVNPFRAPPDQERNFGPFAGDEALISYTLYSDSTYQKPAGTAVLTCEYDFSKSGTCDETFALAGGTIVTIGSFPFAATQFTLSVSGGDESFRGYEGRVTVTAPAMGEPTHGRAIVPISCPCRLLGGQRLALTLRPPVHAIPASHPRLTVYSVTTHEQFINNDDDEARGDLNNPFVTHDRSAINNKGNTTGPFAGDESVFSFNLYSDSSLKKQIGTADFLCQYNFDRNAFCNANFQLDSGTIVGAGNIAFDASVFSLSVTGGGRDYLDDIGDVEVDPSVKGAQRVNFFLSRA
jgi:hypothetical protein